MAIVTQRHHERWIERGDPAAPSLRSFCATDAVPKTMRTKVPRSSAAASRQVPRSMADYSVAPTCASRQHDGPPIEIPWCFGYDKRPSLGDRPTVGHMALDHGIGVRIPVSQPFPPAI